MVLVQFVKEKNRWLLVIIQYKQKDCFLKNLGRFSGEVGKNLATNVLKNPGRAFKITSNIAIAATTKSPKAALSSLPEVINFH